MGLKLHPPHYRSIYCKLYYYSTLESIITYTYRAPDYDQQFNTTGNEVTSQDYVNCRPITCDLNDADVTLTCCLHGNEVYVPFDAVERYFEVGNILTMTLNANLLNVFLVQTLTPTLSA